MSISEKLTTVAENQKKVYDAGKKAEYDRFWDAYQQKGERRSYGFAFAGMWYDNAFRPKYDIIATSTGYMFYSSRITDLAQRLEECGVVLDTSGATSLDNAFSESTITHIPEISTTGITTLGSVFNSARSLRTIDKLILKNDGSQKFTTYTFSNCITLENLVIEGTIGQNGFKVSDSTKLTHDSLMSIINALKDYSGSSGQWLVTLGAANLDKLSAEEKAIATGKGWRLE